MSKPALSSAGLARLEENAGPAAPTLVLDLLSHYALIVHLILLTPCACRPGDTAPCLLFRKVHSAATLACFLLSLPALKLIIPQVHGSPLAMEILFLPANTLLAPAPTTSHPYHQERRQRFCEVLHPAAFRGLRSLQTCEDTLQATSH